MSLKMQCTRVSSRSNTNSFSIVELFRQSTLKFVGKNKDMSTLYINLSSLLKHSLLNKLTIAFASFDFNEFVFSYELF